MTKRATTQTVVRLQETATTEPVLTTFRGRAVRTSIVDYSVVAEDGTRIGALRVRNTTTDDFIDFFKAT